MNKALLLSEISALVAPFYSVFFILVLFALGVVVVFVVTDVITLSETSEAFLLQCQV